MYKLKMIDINIHPIYLDIRILIHSKHKGY